MKERKSGRGQPDQPVEKSELKCNLCVPGWRIKIKRSVELMLRQRITISKWNSVSLTDWSPPKRAGGGIHITDYNKTVRPGLPATSLNTRQVNQPSKPPPDLHKWSHALLWAQVEERWTLFSSESLLVVRYQFTGDDPRVTRLASLSSLVNFN